MHRDPSHVGSMMPFSDLSRKESHLNEDYFTVFLQTDLFLDYLFRQRKFQFADPMTSSWFLVMCHRARSQEIQSKKLIAVCENVVTGTVVCGSLWSSHLSNCLLKIPLPPIWWFQRGPFIACTSNIQSFHSSNFSPEQSHVLLAS